MRKLVTREDVDGFLDDWAAALRSGEYRQGIGYLRTTYGSSDGEPSYCCLGVACDVLGLEYFQRSPDSNTYRYIAPPPETGNYFFEPDRDRESYDLGSATHLPDPIHDAIEFHYPGLVSGMLPAEAGDGTERGWDLTHLNDTLKLSFEAIADVIERRREVIRAAGSVV